MLIQYYDLPFFGLWLYLPFAYIIGIGLGLSLKTKSFKKTWGILALIALFGTLAMIGLSDTAPIIFFFIMPILAFILLTLGYFMGGGARAIYTHGKAKSKHPWGFVILAALFLYSPVLLLSLPSAVKNVDKKNEKPVETTVQSIPDKLGYAYRIQMDLTLIETGEPITIDFMVRCKNTHRYNETNPNISGQVQFKALTTGAAVAASPPREYCEQSLSQDPFDQWHKPQKMPVLIWYDDVNDLSEAWAYMTNDAYSSPLAKVRFIDYKVTRATASQFRKWMQESIQNYEQIGAIPGPLGCGNSLPTHPSSCSYNAHIERNGGKPIKMITNGHASHFRTIPFPTENFGPYRAGHIDFETIKTEMAPTSDFYCRQLWISVPKTEEEFKKHEQGFCRNIISECPDCLKGIRACNIRKVWPKISVKTDKGIVHRMLRKPEYQGFSILKSTAFTVEDLGRFDPIGFRTPNGLADRGVLFVDDELVCDSKSSSFTFFDFKNKEFVTDAGRY